jgi:hypothetical protein
MRYKYDIKPKKLSMNFQQAATYSIPRIVPRIKMPYFVINLNPDPISHIPSQILSYNVVHEIIPTISLNESDTIRDEFIKTEYPPFYETYQLEEFKEKIWKFCMIHKHGGIFTEGLTLPFFAFLKKMDIVIQKNSTTFACIKQSPIIYNILENIQEPVETILEKNGKNIYWLYANPVITPIKE